MRTLTAAVLLAAACGKSGPGAPPRDEPAPPPKAPPDARLEGLAYLEAAARDASIEIVTSTLAGEHRDRGCLDPGVQGLWDPSGHRGCRRCVVAVPGPDLNPAPLWGFGFGLRATPPAMIAAAKLRRIVLCKELHVDGRDVPEGTEVGGTVDRSEGEIWLSVDAPKYQDSAWVIFHHELYHLFGLADGTDREWSELNDDDFRYGVAAGPLPEGFVGRYAMTNYREDQAETYAWMVGRGPDLCSLHATDSILMGKVALIRQRVRDAIGDEAAFIDRALPCVQ